MGSRNGKNRVEPKNAIAEDQRPETRDWRRRSLTIDGGAWNTNLSYLATDWGSGASGRPCWAAGMGPAPTSWILAAPGHGAICYPAAGRRSSGEDWAY